MESRIVLTLVLTTIETVTLTARLIVLRIPINISPRVGSVAAAVLFARPFRACDCDQCWRLPR
jgi:hypothetical protein